MSSQWVETYWLGQPNERPPCACGEPSLYVRFYPDLWQWERPKHVCQECKDNQDMRIRDLVTKAQELTEKKAGV